MQLLKRAAWLSPRRAIQQRLRKIGIEVRKFPSCAFRPISVFSMAVQLLMEKQGTAITFVQVGANDGVFVDPLRPFIAKYPWRGILVEPQPDVFERLVNNYRPYADRLIFENVAISEDKSGLILYRAPQGLVKDGVYASSVASSDASTAAKQLGIAVKNLEKVVAPCLTLDELVAKHGFSSIQILQIDVEGYDWQVLRTLDLKLTMPSIIQFESGHLTRADCNKTVDHLTRHGYEIYWGGYQGDALALSNGLFSI